MSIIRIDRRFRGPPASANGGYACGRLAAFVDGPAEVTLYRPPPLDRGLTVLPGDVGGVLLMDGERRIAGARPIELALEPPPAPSLAEAEEAATRYPCYEGHPYAGCFVCGPERAEGDGLRIFAGRLGTTDRVAAPWTAGASLCEPDGRVRPEFLWSALDCPGFFAAMLGAEPRLALLGRMSARVEPGIHAGDRCVVAGWRLGGEGRKHRVATALFGPGGRCQGRATQTWIEVAG